MLLRQRSASGWRCSATSRHSYCPRPHRRSPAPRRRSGPRAVENGAGLEIVIVDGTVLDVGAAVAAIRIVVIVRVPAVIKGDEAAAAGTPSVIAVAAVGANRVSVVVGQAFTIPEAGAAVGTDLCHTIQAVRAQQTVMELDQVVGGQPQREQVRMGVVMAKFLQNIEIGPRELPGGLHQ